MKDLYFSHDRNALNDNKISLMRGSYGMEGYGVYWAIIEALSREPDLCLEYSARMVAGLSAPIQPSFDMQTFIDDCIEIGLFECDGERFWSNSLKRRFGEIQEQSDRKIRSASNAAKARWEKEKSDKSCDRNATAMRGQCDRSPSAVRPQCVGTAPAMRNDANKNINININSCSSSYTGAGAREGDDLVIDPEWKRVADAYLSEIGTLPGGTAGETLVSYCEDIGADAMIFAIKRTNQAQPDSPYKFLKSILDDYAENGVHSLAEAEARSHDFDRRKQNRTGPPQIQTSSEVDDEPVRWL